MAGLKVPKDLTGEQYLAIEDSLLSSEAGRAFLRMRDKRASVIAMDEHLNALRSLKQWVQAANQRSTEEVHLDVLRRELIEMAASIRKAKSEIWAMKPADDTGGPNSTRRINLATEELDAIVQATERATTDILNGAERIMEVAGAVRDGGLSREAEQLDGEATNILMACGFQDITGQRIAKVVSTLRYLEERVDAMIRIWGVDGVSPEDLPDLGTRDGRPDAHLLNGPALHGGVDQSMVDQLINGTAPIPGGHETGADAVADDWGLAAAEAAIAVKASPVAETKPPAPVKAEKDKKEKKEKAPEPIAMPAAEQLDQSSIDSLFP